MPQHLSSFIHLSYISIHRKWFYSVEYRLFSSVCSQVTQTVAGAEAEVDNIMRFSRTMFRKKPY
jgi:hypothetical protein